MAGTPYQSAETLPLTQLTQQHFFIPKTNHYTTLPSDSTVNNLPLNLDFTSNTKYNLAFAGTIGAIAGLLVQLQTAPTLITDTALAAVVLIGLYATTKL